jgi:hypothetical protein
MRKSIVFLSFTVPALTFALVTILDIVTDESDPGALLSFLMETAVIIAFPVFNYRREKALSSEITARQYNAGYFLGYFLAAAAAIIFICSVNVSDFFPRRGESVWLDLRGLGIIFLAYGIACGFGYALIFRGIAELVKRSKK